MGKKDFTKYRPKVVVAMSGGVDSSVAAALLKKQGYEVVGVFMRFWKPRNDADLSAEQRGNENLCCSAEAEKAARSVAAKLKIPFHVFNFAKEFKKEVVDYFLAESAAGCTPNPCVVCNKKIKFGMLFQKALGLGADFIATGHYTRLRREFPISHPAGGRQKGDNFQFPIKSQNSNAQKLIKLFCAKDKSKDQSYFLYTLTQKQLSHVLFPLGGYTKKEVYQLAKKWRLPYRREESFDLCFTGGDTGGFIKKYLKLKPGRISDLAGEILGEHPGLAFYTTGQRANLGGPGPFYVVRKDSKENILYVSNNEKDLYCNECLIDQVNWLSGVVLHLRQDYGGRAKLTMKIWAKIRYKSEASEATLRLAPPRVRGGARSGYNPLVTFLKPQRAITPGQSAVFYSKKGEVLGGGVIKV